MGGGAWPFLVGGAICQVNSDNERDSSLQNSGPSRGERDYFFEGQSAFSRTRKSNNRSVMPLDVLGRTRATLKDTTGISLYSEELSNPAASFVPGIGDCNYFP